MALHSAERVNAVSGNPRMPLPARPFLKQKRFQSKTDWAMPRRKSFSGGRRNRAPIWTCQRERPASQKL